MRKSTTAALALLNDAVKKGGVMASSHVGGLSGAFIPVSEDAGMIQAAACGALSLEKLEAMTAVCSVGLDMIAIPGDTSEAVISGIIADEIAIGDKAADGSQLRPYIVWFGEAVPMMSDAISALRKGIDIFIIIGTSLNVYPAAGLLNYVPVDVPVYLIDPNEVQVNGVRNVTVIRKGASEGMRFLLDNYLLKMKLFVLILLATFFAFI